MTTAPRRCPTHRLTAVTAALTALIAVALAVLLAKTIHTAAEHQSEIHTAGYHVTICTAQAQRHGDTGIQTLTHIADCVLNDHQIRSEAGDVTLTVLILAGVGAVGWRLMLSRHRTKQ